MKVFHEVRVTKVGDLIGLKARDPTNSQTYPSIGKVLDGSLAADAQLKPGELIVTVNGQDMKGKTGHDVHEIVRNAEINSCITFIVRPKGQVLMQSHGSMLSLGSSTGSVSSYRSLTSESSEDGADAVDDDDNLADEFASACSQPERYLATRIESAATADKFVPPLPPRKNSLEDIDTRFFE